MQSKSKYFIISIVTILALFLAWYLKTIVIYLIVSIILSLIGQPLVRLFSGIRFKKFQLSKTVCSLLSLLSMMLVVIILFSLFIPLIVEQARIISKINPNEVLAAFDEPIKNIEYDLKRFQITSSDVSVKQMIATKLSSVLGFSEISYYAQLMFGFMGSLLAAFFSISFITFFMMKDEHLIYNIVLLLTPPKRTETIKTIMRETKFIMTRYFIGILSDMFFVATVTSIGLSVFGIKNALLIGLFAGILNVIPYFGPLLGLGFALLIGISSNLDLSFYTQLLPLTGKIALVFLFTQLTDALFFQPLVISKTVKAHPLEIFLVILVASTIAGISGMVVAIPIYTIIRIFAKEFLYRFQFIQKLTKDLDEYTGHQKL